MEWFGIDDRRTLEAGEVAVGRDERLGFTAPPPDTGPAVLYLRRTTRRSDGAGTDHKGVPGRQPGVNGQVVDELLATGAVVCGRGTVEPAGFWGGDHHNGVPIFILTRHAPDGERGQWPLVTYVSDVKTATTQAKEAADDNNVFVQGAGGAQLALAAGVLDELELHVIPGALGPRAPSLRPSQSEHIELERTRILEGKPVIAAVRNNREVRCGRR